MLQVFIDFAVPAGLLYIFFAFYNNYQITPSEMVKTSGLLAITLLGLTLIIGPISRIFPALGFLKAHRKFWGILSFVVVLVHTLLVTHFFFKWDLSRFINTSNPKFPGLLSGELALIILLLVTFTSSNKIVAKLNPKTWKIIQTTSYIAMALALSHFYLMETVDGVLVIKRLLGKITFWFSVAVIVARLVVLFRALRTNSS